MPLEENNRYLVREQQAKNRRKSKGIIVGLVLIILALSSSLGYIIWKMFSPASFWGWW